MLTSRSSPFDKLRGSLAGCDEYLTKPLDEDRLLEVIAQFLPSSRKRDNGSEQEMSKSILVVDDTRSMRAMVAAVLQGAGYEVAEAGDGVEALELRAAACSTWWSPTTTCRAWTASRWCASCARCPRTTRWR